MKLSLAHEKKSSRSCFKLEEQALRKIFRRWDPIGGSPSNEYDCLIHHLLSVFQNNPNTSGTTIAAIISKEFADHFGFSVPQDGVERVAKEIFTIWQKQD